MRAISSIGCSTVVSGGFVHVAASMPSKPTIESSSGTSQAAQPGFLQRADGHEIARADHRGRPLCVGLREKLPERLASAADGERGVCDEPVRELSRPESVTVPERLLACRERVLVARHEADALVPELDEMLGCDPPGGALVHADGGHVELLGATVHEHEPRAALEQLRVVRVPAAYVGDLGRDEEHPLDAALEEHPHVVALAAGRAVRVAEDRREPAP